MWNMDAGSGVEVLLNGIFCVVWEDGDGETVWLIPLGATCLSEQDVGEYARISETCCIGTTAAGTSEEGDSERA
jgi:hypothetical protein